MKRNDFLKDVYLWSKENIDKVDGVIYVGYNYANNEVSVVYDDSISGSIFDDLREGKYERVIVIHELPNRKFIINNFEIKLGCDPGGDLTIKDGIAVGAFVASAELIRTETTLPGVLNEIGR